MRRTPSSNTLFYGDNLEILRNYIEDESVDLIYLDPPFNSNANYNVLFKAPGGEQSQAQIEAFEDTWHWNDKAEAAFDQVMTSGNTDVFEMLRAMRGFLKENDMMAYLTMMAVRLIELHRVLKPTGSLYLHCDPTASHYLKILLDGVFGPKNYRNEISWKRTDSHNDAKQGAKHFGRVHDILLFYAKGEPRIFNALYKALPESTVESWYRNVEPETGRRFNKADVTGPGGAGKGNPYYEWNGLTRYWRYNRERMQKLHDDGLLVYSKSGMTYQKRYLDESKGVPVSSIWDDISMLRGLTANLSRQERLGYPTQKPLALLERILAVSSNEGDLVLDPFCGCGTTVHAAQKLGRRWIGIDITHLAIGLVKRRLIEAFPTAQFAIEGVPKDVGGARELAKADKYQFQFWALSMVEAQPYKGGKKGADGGVDGYIYFKPDGRTVEKAVVSVKGGGNVGVGMIRDLIATIEREKAKVGILVSLEDPTTTMRKEAAAAGLYKPEGDQQFSRDFPRIQILTIDDLFEGKKPHLPWIDSSVFKKTKRESTTKQSELEI
jgi:DNA modification methylase